MIYVIGPKDKQPENTIFIDVTSRARSPFSPFLNSTEWPIKANVMENAWQYSKVYSEHIDENGEIKEEWYTWRQSGLDKKTADRYPMGKGRKPLYSYAPVSKWDLKPSLVWQDLGYIGARNRLYIPLYKNMLRNRQQELLELVNLCRENDVAFWDLMDI